MCGGKNLTVLAWTLSPVTSSFVPLGQSPVPISDPPCEDKASSPPGCRETDLTLQVKLDTIPGTMSALFSFLCSYYF